MEAIKHFSKNFDNEILRECRGAEAPISGPPGSIYQRRMLRTGVFLAHLQCRATAIPQSFRPQGPKLKTARG